MPVTMMTDGWRTNVSAGNKISECFVLVFPRTRRVAQAADGSLKRLTNSKTMNVSEIPEFLPLILTIFPNFKKVQKSTWLFKWSTQNCSHQNCPHDAW